MSDSMKAIDAYASAIAGQQSSGLVPPNVIAERRSKVELIAALADSIQQAGNAPVAQPPMGDEATWTEVDLWAEIHRLRAEVVGPDGFATWKEAAVAERVRRVRAESATAPVAQSYDLPEFGSFDDETIDTACAAGELYRSELMRAYEVLRARGFNAVAVAQPADDPDSWEANAKYLLDRCPFTVRQREGGGPEDLKSSLVVTFQGMQMRLEGHPMFAQAAPAQVTLNGPLERIPPMSVEQERALDAALAEVFGFESEPLERIRKSLTDRKFRDVADTDELLRMAANVIAEDGIIIEHLKAMATSLEERTAKHEAWRSKLWELIDGYRTGANWPQSMRDQIKSHIAKMPAAIVPTDKTTQDNR